MRMMPDKTLAAMAAMAAMATSGGAQTFNADNQRPIRACVT